MFERKWCSSTFVKYSLKTVEIGIVHDAGSAYRASINYRDPWTNRRFNLRRLWIWWSISLYYKVFIYVFMGRQISYKPW